MRWVILGLYLALAGAAVATALVSAEDSGARATVLAADGAFELSNSADGGPIFTASGVGPGDSSSGTVAIGASGGEASDLTLSQHDLTDTPGPGGGLLSGRLTLRVRELTPVPSTVYSGPLASMPAQHLGRIEPGEPRRFEFVASLPEAGSAIYQNSVQGASTSIAFAWTASEASAGPAPLSLAVTRVRHRVRHGRLLVRAGCNRACAIAVRGRLRARSPHGHRVARVHFRGHAFRVGSQRLRIKVPRRLRRWLRQQPGPSRLRGRVTFIARDETGASVRTKRTLRLRIVR